MGLRQITVDRVHDPVDIYASDDSRIYASILGAEGIHNIGSCMQCEAIGNNQFKIKDGVASIQGHIAIIDPGDEEILTGDLGVSGYNRIDLIVLDFNTDGQDDEVTLKLIKGTQASNPSDPTYAQQDLTQGGTHRQVPLWRIRYEGALIKEIERYAEPINSLNGLDGLINDILSGEKTVKNSENALKAPDGFEIGSNSDSNKMLKIYTGHDGQYYRIHANHYNNTERLWVELCDSNGNVLETTLYAVDGVATVEKAINATYASKTKRLEVGSVDDPNKIVAWYGANGNHYIAQHGSDGNFYIRLCDTEGQIIKTVLKLTPTGGLVADRAINADNATHALNGFEVGSNDNPNRVIKLFTGDDGQYYRIHAWIQGEGSDIHHHLWIELCNSEGTVLKTTLHAVDGEATVEKAINATYASKTKRLEVGSVDDPNKNIAFYGADGSYYSLDYGTNGKFRIRKYAADGKTSNTVFAVDEEGGAEFNNLKDYVDKATIGLLARPSTITNVKSINLDGTRSGVVNVANSYSGGTSNCPYGSEKFMGLRIQHNITNTISFYLLYEAAPNPGNIWMQVYNNQVWKDLVCVSGRVNIFTGSLVQGNAGPLTHDPYCFKHLELYFDNSTLEFPMIVPVRQSVYGSVALKGDNSFSLIAGHFDLSNNEIRVVALGKLNLTNNNTTTTSKLIRIDGVS